MPGRKYDLADIESEQERGALRLIQGSFPGSVFFCKTPVQTIPPGGFRILQRLHIINYILQLINGGKTDYENANGFRSTILGKNFADPEVDP